MNPFALPGPDFLGFFALVAVTVIAAAGGLRLWLGPGGRAPRRVSDPYAIALLRGGTVEAVRIAVLSLIKRGLLARSGRTLQSVAGAGDQVQDPAESAIIRSCRVATEGSDLMRRQLAVNAFERRRSELAGQGLIPAWGLLRTYHACVAAGISLVAALGLGKAVYAWSHGHQKVLGLMFLTIIAGAALVWLFRHPPLATPRGRVVLGDLHDLFTPLRGLAVAHRPEEALFLAAVFGAAALAPADRADLEGAFRPPPQPDRAQNSYGSCSTFGSCGSSGSGGSSCGGGGCGGGGCGGCGS